MTFEIMERNLKKQVNFNQSVLVFFRDNFNFSVSFIFSSLNIGRWFWVIFLPKNHPYESFFLPYLNLNKWFLHRFHCFFLCFSPYFVVSVRRCVVRRLVQCCLIFCLCGVRLILSERSISVNYKFNMIWMSTLPIQRHEYFVHFDFIILFVSIFSLYVINLNAMSLFIDLSFTFLTMLNM